MWGWKKSAIHQLRLKVKVLPLKPAEFSWRVSYPFYKVDTKRHEKVYKQTKFKTKEKREPTES